MLAAGQHGHQWWRKALGQCQKVRERNLEESDLKLLAIIKSRSNVKWHPEMLETTKKRYLELVE